MKPYKTAVTGVAFALLALPVQAENRIDVIRPDAPDLAAYGGYPVGVREMTFTNPDQADVVNTGADGEIARYNRPLTVEIWYPAADGTKPGGSYDTVLRDGETAVKLTGRAVRNAQVADGFYPLVIVSHGYPGNRWLMSPLSENIASKGYVVASIDHTDSTYSDQAAFGSTLVNRPWDQRFVIDQLAALEDDLGAIMDAQNAAIVGYSMGGYGALIYAGAGVTQASTEYEWGAPQGLLERNMMGTQSHAELSDDRVKAFVAFGPWGNNAGFWDESGFAGVGVPLMLIAGEVDDVSVYDAIRGIFDGTVNTTRHLLTFENANHNAGAPMPSPVEGYSVSETLGWAPFEHYADAVWDNVRMNNISQHFVTAFLDQHLKREDRTAYFDLVPTAADGIWDLDDAGRPTQVHTYWEGFPNRSAHGLRIETKIKGE
ncbi:alpha/beta fold hydrolase [uncultured Ruegeria sp.]|uniref:alpha/beta hydrolase family protein n=1 Tax=uncultured Ruegeria sp. TaxID=259304 RepID=UPI002625F217|nr:alpha/beta fold hydrolase [uncultured Ruegeria sp.]